MNDQKIKEFLQEELEYKKEYRAFRDIQCAGCEDWIEEDDHFIYLGDGKKICDNCSKDISNFLSK